MTIKNFEEIEAWKKARELAGYIYTLTQKESFARDFGLRDQLRRAAGSIMHNIAEGFDSGTDLEFARFLKKPITLPSKLKNSSTPSSPTSVNANHPPSTND